MLGDNRGKAALLAELSHNPKLEVISALIEILDDDIITHLRRCTVKHVNVSAAIIEGMESDDAKRAAKVAADLRNLL